MKARPYKTAMATTTPRHVGTTPRTLEFNPALLLELLLLGLLLFSPDHRDSKDWPLDARTARPPATPELRPDPASVGYVAERGIRDTMPFSNPERPSVFLLIGSLSNFKNLRAALR